jgi:hypothetical protein
MNHILEKHWLDVRLNWFYSLYVHSIM